MLYSSSIGTALSFNLKKRRFHCTIYFPRHLNRIIQTSTGRINETGYRKS